MAYRNDIAALGADHHWDFDGDALDQIGTVNGTATSIIYTSSAIAEDAINCAETNAIAGDIISIPTTTEINNSAQARKAVAGWYSPTSINAHPVRIYGEGDNTTCFQFVMAYGNNVMFECVEPTNFTLQVFGDHALEINRSYHLCGIFEGNGYGNQIRFYIDGVEQTNAEPINRQPGTASLDARGVAEFADPAGTVGLGGDVVLLQAAKNGKYNHWATWGDTASAVLTTTQVREELFEKGALPGVTIASGTQSVMQTSLNAYSSTIRPNEPLNIRINTVTGDGNLTLTANNITHNALASIHVQYMGTGTLTWINSNGSNASIGSTPGGGTIIFQNPVAVTVTVLDSTTFSPVTSVQVLLEANTGGPLAAGTVILSGTTNGSGIITDAAFGFTTNQPVVGKVRKGTTAPFYKTSVITGTITSAGFSATILIEPDSVAQ